MSKGFIYIIFFIFPAVPRLNAQDQILPANRRVNWAVAGLAQDFPATENVLNLLDYGGDDQGQMANDDALRQAINDLNGQYGIIHFPPGNYLFKETIQLKDSTILRGEGANRTNLLFDLGGKGHLINAEGSTTGNFSLLESAESGTDRIVLQSTEGLKSGDFIRIHQNDGALIVSDWALRSTGQITRIVNLTSQGEITLADPLRVDYELGLNPEVEKIQPVVSAAVTCLKIERNDQTSSQTSNIHFKYAVYCQVQGVESNRCNFSHITLSYSYGIKISGSYFHHGFTYGGGGKAYGVTAQFSSSNCLVENNIFERLRHAMLLQAGANGNVFAYNYSTDPFWEEALSPANAAGDLVLHGNYPYANLFEGNIGQNLVIDDSHEINGPFNTFFRNRAELFGFIMFPNPPSDRQNILGNEITNTESSKGFFLTFGNDHLIHDNRVKGEVIPENTSVAGITSYYLTEKPEFLGNYPWPAIGSPNQPNFHSIPARDRHLKANLLTPCGSERPIVTDIGDRLPTLFRVYLFPNPTGGEFTLDLGKKPTSPVDLQVINPIGQSVFKMQTGEQINNIHLSNLPRGFYFVKIRQDQLPAATLRIILY